jgi:hydrogenase maturation factor
VAKEKLDNLMEAMERKGVKWAKVIGEIVAEPIGEVSVEP